jgi:8-oxo-dGTP pyrophosphatase MutT (NUDIX family)
VEIKRINLVKHINLFEGFKRKKVTKVHTLSGIALIVEGKLLLVQAKKYIGQDNKWSLPKGHIEGDSLDSALKELEEETGIHLDKKYDTMIEIDYKKGSITKLMDVYIYKRKKESIKKYLKNWSVNPEFYDVNEIIDAKFFSIASCRKKMDIGMIEILDNI